MTIPRTLTENRDEGGVMLVIALPKRSIETIAPGSSSSMTILFVSGRAEHLKRRVRDWLKEEARRSLGVLAHEFAARLARPVRRITIRDPRSRWGSCSRDGTLSLSWRLVLAPERVARYVVAHEAAHLKHMNHSAAFWRTVDSLVDDAAPARAWLRRHGAALHGFGGS